MSQENSTLAASRRELVGKKTRRLRKEGILPAVLYGYHVEPTNLQLSTAEFEAAYKRMGNTTLVDLEVDSGEPVKAFIQEVQRHPISRAPLHADFHAVNLRVAVDSEVPVVLIGEAPAVHNNVGVLLRGLETVSVHALPTDLPQHLEVSIGGLQEVDQALHVSDIPVEGNYEIRTDAHELIAKIVHQQLEVEEEEVEEEAEAETVEAEGGEPETAETSDGQ